MIKKISSYLSTLLVCASILSVNLSGQEVVSSVSSEGTNGESYNNNPADINVLSDAMTLC